MISNYSLIKKLEEINLIVQKEYSNLPNLGGVAGVSGCSLFQFYYAKYLDDDSPSNMGMEMISFCIEKINKGYSYPTYCGGIAGLCWTIQHLESEEFIDLDCDDLLGQFDDFLYGEMKLDLSQGKFDFLHGALGYGFYFFKRFRYTKKKKLKALYQNYLLELVQELNHLATKNGDYYKWESVLDVRTGNRGYNFSLSHGMSSIINFLSRLMDFQVFKEPVEKLLLGGINYMLNFQSAVDKNVSLFPSSIEKETLLEYDSRLAWCYGDLGVGISLLRASKTLDDHLLDDIAVKILKHTAVRREEKNTKVVDASICHGSYGNAQIYNYLNSEIPGAGFNGSLDFWITDGMERAYHKDGYAGYKQWNGLQNTWTKELSLLEGVAGIGLTIIDYLSEEPNTWDECLMIG